MFLRLQLEKLTPIKEDEAKLSDDATRVVFKGAYLMRGQISSVTPRNNLDSRTQDRWPTCIEVTRTTKGGMKSVTRGKRYSTPYIHTEAGEIIDELKTPAVLKRANRVEKLARKIKLSAAGVLVASAIIVGISAASIHDPSAPKPLGVEAGDGAIIGNETLAPLAPEKVQTAQQLGETACRIGEYDFVVIGGLS